MIYINPPKLSWLCTHSCDSYTYMHCILTVYSFALQFEFVDFSLTETVFIEFYTERITSPDGEEPVRDS